MKFLLESIFVRDPTKRKHATGVSMQHKGKQRKPRLVGDASMEEATRWWHKKASRAFVD